MDPKNNYKELMAQAAKDNSIPVEVLENLLGLESHFTSLSIYSSKVEFSRRVATILDAAAQQDGV